MLRGFEIRQMWTSYGTEQKPLLSSSVRWGNNTISFIKKVVVLKCLVQPVPRVIRLSGGVNWQLLVITGHGLPCDPDISIWKKGPVSEDVCPDASCSTVVAPESSGVLWV